MRLWTRLSAQRAGLGTASGAGHSERAARARALRNFKGHKCLGPCCAYNCTPPLPPPLDARAAHLPPLIARSRTRRVAPPQRRGPQRPDGWHDAGDGGRPGWYDWHPPQSKRPRDWVAEDGTDMEREALAETDAAAQRVS